MKRIRIGKDIVVKWDLTVNGEIQDLSSLDLTIEMMNPKGEINEIDNFTVDYNTITIQLLGTSFKQLGKYSFTCWLNKGKVGQTVVDVIDAFELVKYTTLE